MPKLNLNAAVIYYMYHTCTNVIEHSDIKIYILVWLLNTKYRFNPEKNGIKANLVSKEAAF